MKKELTKIQNNLYYYKDGAKIEGKNEGLSGDCTNLSGDLDDCKITAEEREKGIDISELVK
jgi:hypothetical protein